MAALPRYALEPKKLFRYFDPNLDQAIFLPEPIMKISKDLLEPRGSPIYWIVGARGSGKSQLLHYVARQFLEKLGDRRILPVFVEMRGSYGESVFEANRFRENFAQFLLKSLFSLHTDVSTNYSISPFTLGAGRNGGSSVRIENLQTYLADYLSKGEELFDKWVEEKSEGWASEKAHGIIAEMIKRNVVNSLVVVVDDFDKYRYEIISQCLLKQQGFYSTLIDMGCRLFFTASTDWFEFVSDRGKTEWNFYQGVAGANYCKVPPVSSIEDAKALLEQRHLATRRLEGGLPFLPGAYMALIEISDGIRRTLIDYAQVVLDELGQTQRKIGREKVLRVAKMLEKSPTERYVDAMFGRPPDRQTRLTPHQTLWKLSKDERLKSLFRIFYRKPEITYDVNLVGKYSGHSYSSEELERDMKRLRKLGALKRKAIPEEIAGIVTELLDDLMIDLDGLFGLIATLPETLISERTGPLQTGKLTPSPPPATDSWSEVPTRCYVAWRNEEIQPYLLTISAQTGLAFDYDIAQSYLGREYSLQKYLLNLGILARMGLVSAQGPLPETRESVVALRSDVTPKSLDLGDLVRSLILFAGAASSRKLAGELDGYAAEGLIPPLSERRKEKMMETLADDGDISKVNWEEVYYIPQPEGGSEGILRISDPVLLNEVSSWLQVVRLNPEPESLFAITQDLVKSWLLRQSQTLANLTGKVKAERLRGFDDVDRHAQELMLSDTVDRFEFTKQLLAPEAPISNAQTLVSSAIETLASMGEEISASRERIARLTAFESGIRPQRIKETDGADIVRISEHEFAKTDLIPALFRSLENKPFRWDNPDRELLHGLQRTYIEAGIILRHKCGLEIWVERTEGLPTLHHVGCKERLEFQSRGRGYWIRSKEGLELLRRAASRAVLEALELPGDYRRRTFVSLKRRRYDFFLLSAERGLGFEILRTSSSRNPLVPRVRYSLYDLAKGKQDPMVEEVRVEPEFDSVLRVVRNVFLGSLPRDNKDSA